MSNVLLSIKPKYCDLIKKGVKKIEYRKVKFRMKPNYIFIYCSSPIKKILGYFSYRKYIESDVKSIWEKTKNVGGISNEIFLQYYKNKERGFAIYILNLNIFKEQIDPREFINDFHAPQNFLYLSNEESLFLLKQEINHEYF